MKDKDKLLTSLKVEGLVKMVLRYDLLITGVTTFFKGLRRTDTVVVKYISNTSLAASTHL